MKTDGKIPSVGSRSRLTSSKYASRSLEDWRTEASWAMNMALAPSTRRSYDKAVYQFTVFHKHERLPDIWPILMMHLIQFCVTLKGKGLSVSSIRGKLAALAFASKAVSFVEPSGNFCIVKMFEGWALEDRKPWNSREPMSLVILTGLMSAWPLICTSKFEAYLFHSIFGAL